MSTVSEDQALNGAPRDRQPPARGGGPDPVPNALGAEAVQGSLRALSALLVPLGGRGRRQRRKVAQWTTSSTQFLAALSSAVDAARRADRHAAAVPPRGAAWSLPTLLLVMAVLTAADYLGVNAILRAANLPQRASFTLPLVISVTLLVSAKVLAHWDLGSVTAPDREPDREPHRAPDPTRDDGADAAAADAARRLEALTGPVKRRKRAVLRLAGPLAALGIAGLFLGLGGLGAGLGGGLGLNDGEHDDLLLLAAFGVIAGIVLLNVCAALALAYGMYTPGAAEYRAAVRNAQVKWLYVRFLSATARPERRSRRLLENLSVMGERAQLRAALGHHEGMRELLLADPGERSARAAALADDLARRLGDRTPDALHRDYEQRLARLERHLTPAGPAPVPAPRWEAPGATPAGTP
ncbi:MULTISPECIES: hypothetical protein [unclassified Blastococcus]